VKAQYSGRPWRHEGIERDFLGICLCDDAEYTSAFRLEPQRRCATILPKHLPALSLNLVLYWLFSGILGRHFEAGILGSRRFQVGERISLKRRCQMDGTPPSRFLRCLAPGKRLEGHGSSGYPSPSLPQQKQGRAHCSRSVSPVVSGYEAAHLSLLANIQRLEAPRLNLKGYFWAGSMN
jgi:hypothetical protein